jgi:presequence protease
MLCIRHIGEECHHRSLTVPCIIHHKKSGAELLSVSRDDDNKFSSTVFLMPPDDSTGVAHILEHSAMCGSQKYTRKAPFVWLPKAFLSNFLHAFMQGDRTSCIAASQNQKDFYNIVHVYVDAVYNPRAVKDPMVVAQEWGHFEINDENDLDDIGIV